MERCLLHSSPASNIFLIGLILSMCFTSFIFLIWLPREVLLQSYIYDYCTQVAYENPFNTEYEQGHSFKKHLCSRKTEMITY